MSKAQKSWIIYGIVFLVFVAAAYVASVIATAELYNKHAEAVLERMQDSQYSADLKIDRNGEPEKSWNSVDEKFTFSLYKGALKFDVQTVTTFAPFSAQTVFHISNIGGTALECDFCDYKKLVISGLVGTDFITNSFKGKIGVEGGRYAGDNKDENIEISGLRADISGSFVEHLAEVSLNVGSVKGHSNSKKIDFLIKNLSGVIGVDTAQLAAKVSTNAEGLKADEISYQNRFADVKTVVTRPAIIFKSSDSQQDVTGRGLLDLDAVFKADKISYDKGSADSEFSVGRVALNLKINKADQLIYRDIVRFVNEAISFAYEPNKSDFNFDVLMRLAQNGTEVKFDRLQMQSDISGGLLKIAKGSEMTFPGKNSGVKNNIALSIDFHIDEAFIKDFPNGKELKQKFINNDWLVHGTLDSKDEYSTKLTVREGQCSLGQRMLDHC